MKLVSSIHKTIWTSAFLPRLPKTFITYSLKGFCLTQAVCKSLFCCTLHLMLSSCKKGLQQSGLNHTESSIALQKQFSSKLPNWAAAYWSHKDFFRGWAQWNMMVYQGMDGHFSNLWRGGYHLHRWTCWELTHTCTSNMTICWPPSMYHFIGVPMMLFVSPSDTRSVALRVQICEGC